MNGDRLTHDQAQAMVGGRFAGHVNAGASSGTWVEGELVSYCESPTITIRLHDGTLAHYAISCIKDWAGDPMVRDELAPYSLGGMGRELCVCGHSYTAHDLRVTGSPGCDRDGCGCKRYTAPTPRANRG